jgi:uncharacterized protein (TIGR04255 family)
MQGEVLPERINPDAILEALVELRFDHTELPELVLGRLLDAQLWAGYEQVRLPTADIPQPIREMDVNLRYQPLVELRKGDGTRVAKIGGHVMSYHVVGPYPGWSVFKDEIEIAVREAIAKLKSPQLSRIGFRYINILRPDEHHVHGLVDTNVTLKVGNEVLTESVAVNYVRMIDPNHTITVRVATPDLVAGNVRPGFSILCDIDIATKAADSITNDIDALTWIEQAHTLEKAEFFAILPERIAKKLGTRTEGDGNG